MSEPETENGVSIIFDEFGKGHNDDRCDSDEYDSVLAVERRLNNYPCNPPSRGYLLSSNPISSQQAQQDDFDLFDDSPTISSPKICKPSVRLHKNFSSNHSHIKKKCGAALGAPITIIDFKNEVQLNNGFYLNEDRSIYHIQKNSSGEFEKSSFKKSILSMTLKSPFYDENILTHIITYLEPNDRGLALVNLARTDKLARHVIESSVAVWKMIVRDLCKCSTC